MSDCRNYACYECKIFVSKIQNMMFTTSVVFSSPGSCPMAMFWACGSDRGFAGPSARTNDWLGEAQATVTGSRLVGCGLGPWTETEQGETTVTLTARRWCVAVGTAGAARTTLAVAV